MRYHSPKRQQSTRDLRSLRPILVTRAAGHCEHCGTPFRITDDGQPGPASEPGFGLLGMTERAQLLGGSLHAGPASDGGWMVEAVLPA